MLPPFVRDWISLLQRHLRVDSRLLSQSFKRSAPSLVELVMPMPWFYRRVDKDGKLVRQKRLSSRIIVETYFRRDCCMQPSLPLSPCQDWS